MTDRTETLSPPIFDLGRIKRERFAVNIDSCSIMKKNSKSSKCFFESKIKTTWTFILAKLCPKLSGTGEKKELLIKLVWEKR